MEKKKFAKLFFDIHQVEDVRTQTSNSEGIVNPVDEHSEPLDDEFGYDESGWCTETCPL